MFLAQLDMIMIKHVQGGPGCCINNKWNEGMKRLGKTWHEDMRHSCERRPGVSCHMDRKWNEGITHLDKR